MNATDAICNRPQRDEGYVLVICAAVLGIFALIAVLMRTFIAVRQKSFGYDDVFACLAASMSVPNSIGLATSARLGLGRDVWTLTPTEITRIQKVRTLGSGEQKGDSLVRSYTSARISTSGVLGSRSYVSCSSSCASFRPRAQGDGVMLV